MKSRNPKFKPETPHEASPEGEKIVAQIEAAVEAKDHAMSMDLLAELERVDPKTAAVLFSPDHDENGEFDLEEYLLPPTSADILYPE